MHAQLAGFVLLEQIESNAFEQGKILRCMFLPLAILILTETDIQNPVQFVFNSPMLADGLI